MKRLTLGSLLLCLLIGFLLGGLIPMPWDEDDLRAQSAANSVLNVPTTPPANASASSNGPAPETLDVKNNFTLLSSACAVPGPCRSRIMPAWPLSSTPRPASPLPPTPR